MPSEINTTVNTNYGLRQQVAKGLIYAHCDLNANTSTTLEAAAFVYALVEPLVERARIGLDFATAIPNPGTGTVGLALLIEHEE